MSDERERLYSRAIKERDSLPIRGQWAKAIQKERERKRKRKEEIRRMKCNVQIGMRKNFFKIPIYFWNDMWYYYFNR